MSTTTTFNPDGERNLLTEYHNGDEFAAAVIDEVIAVLDRELVPEYACHVSEHGRERLLEALALVHVQFNH
jgi:hypothetical protein